MDTHFLNNLGLKLHAPVDDLLDALRAPALARYAEIKAERDAEYEAARVILFENQPTNPLLYFVGEELEFYNLLTSLEIFQPNTEKVKIALILSTRDIETHWDPDCPTQSRCIKDLSFALTKFKKLSDKIVLMNDQITGRNTFFGFDSLTDSVFIIPKEVGGRTAFRRINDNHLHTYRWWGFLDVGQTFPTYSKFFPLTILMPQAD